MGYELHITRTEDWLDSETTPITLAEWWAYVERDPDMRFDGFAEAEVEGEVLRVESAGLAVWTAYSRDGEDGNHAWFDWHKGRIVLKNPDDEMRSKMCEIAISLDARVVGDDGEHYVDGELATMSPSQGVIGNVKPWWRRLIGG